MKKVLAIIMCILVSVLGLTACQSEKKKKNNEFNIELNTKVEYMIVGEQYRLLPQAGDSSAKLEWESDDKQVADVKQGLVTAKAAGVCSVSVKSEMSKAICKIIVCDSIVAKEYDESSLGFNKVRFNSLQAAASLGGSIVVMEGEYAEHIVLTKMTKIKAVGSVKILSIYGSEFSLDGITVQSSVAPKENGALIFAEKNMQLNKCKVLVSTSKEAQKLKGGSAVAISPNGNKLSIKDCHIGNVAYGVNVYRFMGEIEILTSSFNNCKIGILVDVRASENMIADYPTLGVVRGNSFINNWKEADFLFSGESYNGKLDFYDFSKLSPKPQMDKNA